jgi:hypothetical protein
MVDNLTKSQIRHRKLKADADKIPLMELQISEIQERISLINHNLLKLNRSVYSRYREKNKLEISDDLAPSKVDWTLQLTAH